ncbi:enoyl-CoA hydratase [Pseudooceanicola sp. 216_PA32_1]|uniref:Enoyl-CoA hydratase n=1 Tax=Pseudooceanicola pacificus TaxID=2676438 RepID=A0A844W5E7_9RHOB|nr:enoyl-CoA hydratase-related protein [Pseudooceanicola pacificus]MWB78041.1 enoyl-CoA hydratase [Pseudooceanicola pacificus]
MNNHISTERRGRALWITIERPEVRNALNPPAHRELAAAFDAYAADDALWVAVLTGRGDRAFCVGSDLKHRVEAGSNETPDTGFAGLCERYDLDKPVIAAINGDALGGGLETVLACDLAVAVDTARLGLPEPRVGLCAHGGLHRLIRHLPGKTASRLALTGKLFSAAEGKAMHLVNEVVPRDAFEACVEALVEEVTACAPLALRATKQMMQRGLSAPDVKAAFAGDYPAYRHMLASEDAREGPLAFSQKRPPVWTGR